MRVVVTVTCAKSVTDSRNEKQTSNTILTSMT